MMRAFLRSVLALVLLATCEGRKPPPAAPQVPTQATTERKEAAESEPTRPSILEGIAADVHYVELLTQGAPSNARLPMIVAIHGLGDEPRSFAEVVRDLPIPARVILPRALDPYEGGGYWWFSVRARDNDPEGLARGIDHAAEKVAAALRELVRKRPTIGKPIVTGFSQGGMVTFALAVHHPDVVGAAFPVGGLLPPQLLPQAPGAGGPPIVALHGDADFAVPYETAQKTIDHLEKLGIDAKLRAYEGIGHQITPQMRQDLHDLVSAAAAGHRKANRAVGR
jgi:phospholipase/carboxylesterase